MRGLIVCSCLIAAAAVAMPGVASRLGGRGSRDAGPAQAVAPSSSRHAAWPSATFKAGRDGHFYLDAFVGTRPVRFMLDTGASTVALRESDAARLGIRVRPGDPVVGVRTANGETRAALTELSRVEIDDIEVTNVQALILPDAQLGISLLGGSFLNRLRRFEVADGQLVFEN